jgi:hypothetical protein
MVFGHFRFKLDARPYVRRLVRDVVLPPRLIPGLIHSVVALPASMLMSIRRAVWLLMSGVLVCTALTACGGRDDDDRAVSSTTSQDGSQPNAQSGSQASPQLDSATVANASPPASGALVPPVMHYAQ